MPDPTSRNSRSVRLGELERLLPFFRLAADEDVVTTILEELADIPDAVFVRACRHVVRGNTAGNPIERIRAAAKAAAAPTV